MLDPRIRLLALSGELDLATEREVRAELAQAAGDRSRELVVDLRPVTFIDSSGLALIVHAHLQLERQGRALACVVRDGAVRRLLDQTGLADTLPAFDTPEQAVAHVLRERPDAASAA